MPPRKGRPPIETPKNVSLEIRLTQEQAKVLSSCAERLNVSRTDVINRGIELVRMELDAK